MGLLLEGIFRVERVLGEGGMGTVYAARNVRTGDLFAVKVLHRRIARDEASSPASAARRG